MSSPLTRPPATRRAPRAALAGVRDAHGGGTRCPHCGHTGDSPLAELELEVNPVGPVHPHMLMEHLGHAAAETESEAEAEAFIGALVPLAAQVLPRAAPALMRVAPQLIRGAVRVGQTLWRNPQTRRLVQAVPTIVTRTAQNVARRAGAGRPITPQWAVRTLARNADRVLSNPRERARVQQRARRIDQRYHRAACPRTYVPGTPDPLRDRGPLRPVDLSPNPLIGSALRA
jgi:hypothetical protein